MKTEAWYTKHRISSHDLVTDYIDASNYPKIYIGINTVSVENLVGSCSIHRAALKFPKACIFVGLAVVLESTRQI